MPERDSSADRKPASPPTIGKALGLLVVTLLPIGLVTLLFSEPKCCTSPIGLTEMLFELGLCLITGVAYGLVYPWGSSGGRSGGCLAPCLAAFLFLLAVVISNAGSSQRLTLTDHALVYLISLLFAGPAAAFLRLVHALQMRGKPR